MQETIILQGLYMQVDTILKICDALNCQSVGIIENVPKLQNGRRIALKKILLILFSALLMLSIAGCGTGTQTKEDNPIPIVDKIYLNNSPFSEKTLDFDFLKFYDDGTFQGLDTSYKSYHGTYAIDGNALTLNLSDKTYAGVVIDEGASVTFGSDEFKDWTEHIKSTDPLLEKFK